MHKDRTEGNEPEDAIPLVDRPERKVGERTEGGDESVDEQSERHRNLTSRVWFT